MKVGSCSEMSPGSVVPVFARKRKHFPRKHRKRTQIFCCAVYAARSYRWCRPPSRAGNQHDPELPNELCRPAFPCSIRGGEGIDFWRQTPPSDTSPGRSLQKPAPSSRARPLRSVALNDQQSSSLRSVPEGRAPVFEAFSRPARVKAQAACGPNRCRWQSDGAEPSRRTVSQSAVGV